MNSCIYVGKVCHNRLAPVRNNFCYRLFMIYLDLGELNSVFKGRWFWSISHFNLASLRREDHLGDPRLPLDTAVRLLVRERTGVMPRGPICMLTHLRYFGHCFNPVTFYYCFSEPGQRPRVQTIIAEIHNTPWNEEYCYVLGEKMNKGDLQTKIYRFPKQFHVSPFIDMNIDYEWRFSNPGETLRVQMEDRQATKKIFEADLNLERRKISGPNLTRVLFVYPLMTVKVLFAIYRQALSLKLKGAPFYSHPEHAPNTMQS